MNRRSFAGALAGALAALGIPFPAAARQPGSRKAVRLTRWVYLHQPKARMAYLGTIVQAIDTHGVEVACYHVTPWLAERGHLDRTIGRCWRELDRSDPALAPA
jgi:hypothetical protein